MRALLLTCLLAVSASAQPGPFGAFTGSADVGTPPIKGSAQFDAAAGQYRITGSGTDIWGPADEFHYVWREVTGNVAVPPGRRSSAAATRTALRDPVLVGLVVCSHDATRADTAVFSDVSIDTQAPATGAR